MEIFSRRFREIRIPRIGLILPKRVRRFILQQCTLDDEFRHRVRITGRWQLETWSGLPEDRNLSSEELRADPARWGLPKVLDLGLNEVPDVGEDTLIAALTDSEAGLTLTAHFDNANAHIGVGDNNTAFAEAQTDLQAPTNRLRKAMNGSYPQDSGAQTVDFQSDFGGAEANFAWAEWGLFNHATFGSGQMFSRRVQSLGTKTAGQTWTITATYDFSAV